MEAKLREEIIAKYTKKEALVISGKCPMTDSVDNWAIEFAIKHGYKTQEFPPEEQNKTAYFDRNQQIAEAADILLVFIDAFQYRSGAWNTVRHFRRLGGRNYKIGDETGYYKVFTEDGLCWDRSWR